MYAQSSNMVRRACELVFTFLVLCCFTNKQGVSATDNQNSSVTITHKIDKDAEFTCTVPALGKRKLIWRRLSDPYPISVGTARFAPDRRYMASKESPESYKLTIRDVGVKDAGEYECRVSGQEGLFEIITLNVKGGPKRPYLKQTDTVVKAEEGDTVLLPCEVENLSSKTVLWRNERNEVVTLRRKNYIGDRNFRIIHDTAPQWSLRIQKVEKWHFGYYTCVINSNPVITRTVHLRRTVAPKFAPKLIKDVHYRSEVKAMAGDLVKLTCNFRANPPAKVNWYRRVNVNGKSKKQDLGVGSTLTLRYVSPEQSGTYFCVGKNELMPRGRGRTRLSVTAPTTTVPPTTTTTVLVPTGPVSPHMYHEGNNFTSSKGLDLTLTCTAIAQPRAYVHWYRHGFRLKNDHKYDISSKRFGRYNTTGYLLIRSLNSRDFGDYKCNGYNDLGVTSLYFKINKEA